MLIGKENNQDLWKHFQILMKLGFSSFWSTKQQVRRANLGTRDLTNKNSHNIDELKYIRKMCIAIFRFQGKTGAHLVQYFFLFITCRKLPYPFSYFSNFIKSNIMNYFFECQMVLKKMYFSMMILSMFSLQYSWFVNAL